MYMTLPKICLNMIVKNESNIIVRLLETVTPLIDSYCICDTGSTDNTINLIEDYCNKNNIPGKILKEPFKDFGYNRSFALRGCNNMNNADYILLMDADMKLEIKIDDINNFKKTLTKDAYYVIQGTNDFYNNNIRIIRNDPKYSYWGVTHEYIELPDTARIDNISSNVMFINDVGDGGSKSDKYKRDIELLKQGLIDNPNNSRYLFYLANSYRDSQQYEEAISTYRQRIAIEGWIQETWHSYYSMANCYMKINQHEKAIFYWLEAYQYMPTRIENLYKIINYYRYEKKYGLALLFYELAIKIRSQYSHKNHLFLENDIYEHKLDYEMSIIGYYTNMNKTKMITMCMMLLNKKSITSYISNNIFNNYKYYCSHIKEFAIKNTDMNSRYTSLLDILDNIGVEKMKEQSGMYPSTPSLSINKKTYDEIYVCKRYVNYKIDENGQYINQENIITVNIFAVIKEIDGLWYLHNEFVMDYNHEYDDNNMYKGIEDVKLLHIDNTIYYTANRVSNTGDFGVEHGVYDYITNKIIESSMLSIDNPKKYEKNWTMFIDNTNNYKFVYEWYPLTICNKNNDKLDIITKIETPIIFNKLRGSTNGIIIGDEIWFLCHIVSYEKRRYYYHIITVIDKNTYKLKKYTQLFTFEKEIVEYSLGFDYFEKEDSFIISYSTNDNESKYMLINKSRVDNLFIQLD
jgi:tetratricopeptide (TPR) repeat protein